MLTETEKRKKELSEVYGLPVLMRVYANMAYPIQPLWVC